MIKIFRNFFVNYSNHFFILILVIIFEGIVNLIATFSLIPFAEYILDPELSAPSKITSQVLNIYQLIDLNISFWSLGLMFVFFNFFKVFNFILIRFFILKIKYLITFGIYSDLVRNFLKSDWIFFSKIDRGKFFNTFTKEMDVVGNTIGNLTTQVANLFQVLFYILVPLYINFQLTILILFLISLFSLPFLYISKFAYFFGKKNLESANFLILAVSEIIQGAKIILSHQKQIVALKSFKDRFSRHIHFTIRSQIINQALPQIFLPCAIFSVIASIGYLIDYNLKLSELTGIMWSLLAIIPVFLSMIKSKTNFSSFIPSYDQLMSFKKQAAEGQRSSGRKKFNLLKKEIKFLNVSFKYDREVVLNKINLKFKKNKITVIVGHSGSGKSTILDIILKMMPPASGKVLIDQENISDINVRTLRDQIGFVSQDTFLFNTTIRNNLFWSNPNATNKDLYKALKDSFCYDFIEKLPKKLDTEVGDRGAMLSGGERQRITLARALIRKPKILLLDEATSALDSISENHVVQSLKRIAKTTTIILSSHKLSFLQFSDRIIVVEKGKVIEDGTYNELTKKRNSMLSKMLYKKTIK